jgi:GrpB-like predicted nucleotidyltransferase (UPF0157 family)
MNEEESLLSAINEDVALRPFDAHWAAMFTAERKHLESLFPGSFIDIQHFGSTAVPGLTAKPVIDILAGVLSMPAADALMEPLCRAGYTTSAEFNATLSDRRWLMKWADGHRTHHLHIVVHGGDEWRLRLAFRDALRSNSKLAEQYGRLKQELALRFPSDREAYSDAKAEFVKSVVASPE